LAFCICLYKDRMPIGLKHTKEAKDKISAAAKKTMSQPNAGFRQRVKCQFCDQEMSPANMGKHANRCRDTRGIELNGQQLTVREIKRLRTRLKPLGWTVEDYVRVYREQQGRCFLCNSEPQRSLSADHCHTSGKSRALLCDQCNLGLGSFKDDPNLMIKAAEYIKSFM